LEDLDAYLTKIIDEELSPYDKLGYINLNNLQNKLKQYSFVDGFENKKFYKFSKVELEEILSIWKHL